MQLEDLKFLLGKGRYLDDVRFQGEVYLHVIRSPYARADLTRISPPPNSLLFLRWEAVKVYMPAVEPPGARVRKMPALANGRVNFYGQPVAAVVTEDRYEGEDVEEEVSVEYEPLPPSLKLENPDVIIHEGVEGNVSNEVELKGGDPSAFREAQVEVHRRLEMARVVANPMETRGIIANYHDGFLDVIVSTQSPFGVRNGLTEALGLPPERVRVFSSDVGGGFGNKSQTYAEYAIASIASMKLGRPVKWVESRREHLTNPVQGKGLVVEASLYAKRDGTVLGVKGRVIHDIGAYNFSINTAMATFPARLLTGPYAMKAAEVKAISVFTNLPPTGPYRGAGRPEAALVHEALLEDLAEELGADPVELRRKNLIKGPYVSPLGLQFDRAGYMEVLERAEKRYRELRASGRRPVLVAFSALISSSPGESAKVRLTEEGIEVIVGSRTQGQGHITAFTNLASEVLGVPAEKVKVRPGDTVDLKEAVGTFGSRSAAAGGAAVFTALKQIKERIGGLSLEEAFSRMGRVEVEVFYRVDPIFSPGSYVVSAELDGETCTPRVQEVYAVDDVGRVLNAQDLEAQITGGVLQGVSEVLWEEARYGEEGVPVYSSVGEEGVPSAVEASFMVSKEIVEYPSSLPHGARGIGESGTIGALAGAFLALEKVLGRRLRRVPVRPDELCAVLTSSPP
jgi:carbon-monoxide dehydrogenase large subunit